MVGLYIGDQNKVVRRRNGFLTTTKRKKRVTKENLVGVD